MGEDGTDTKERLLDAAELLMAEHGIEGAELNEIHRLAGQRNRSAVAYHFGDRDGLLLAIGARRRAVANATRNRALDRLEREGEFTVRALVDAMVRPLAVHLADAQQRAYLVVLAEAATRLGSAALLTADRADVDSMHRLGEHLLALLSGPAPARRRAIGRAVLITPQLVADIAREIDSGAITPGQGRRQVAEVVAFITRSLTDRD